MYHQPYPLKYNSSTSTQFHVSSLQQLATIFKVEREGQMCSNNSKAEITRDNMRVRVMIVEKGKEKGHGGLTFSDRPL